MSRAKNRRWSDLGRTVDLSVSAMATAADARSMVGAPPRRTQHFDMYSWLRTALRSAGVSVERHEALAEKAGPVAAAEVRLLIIAKKSASPTSANGRGLRIRAFLGCRSAGAL